VLWLIVGTALPVATGVLVALSASLRGRIEQLVALAVVAVAQIVVTLLVCGVVLESLSRATVLTANLVVTAVVAVLAARSGALRDALRAWRRPRRSLWVREPLRRWWAWVLGALVVVGSVYLTLVAYTMPSYGFDAVWYHLTAVASWVDAGRIGITPLEPIANVFPMNGELSFLWVGVLTKSDLLIDLPQIGFALLGALSVVAIARVARVSRPGAVVAGCLYFLTPIVLAQASTNYVDIVLPSLFLAGFAFLYRYTTTLAAGDRPEPRRERTLLLLAGAGVGLAAGAKTSGLVYAAVAFALLGVNLFVAVRHGHVHRRAALGALTLFVVPVLALGSFWYVRSWVEYGNPIEPLTVKVGDHTVFTGLPRYEEGTDGLDAQMPQEIRDQPALLRPLASWVGEPTSYDYQQRIGGLGWQWLLLELPALLLLLGYCVWKRRGLLANLLVPFLVMFVLTPANWWSRLTIALVAPGAVALVWIVERVRAAALVGVLEVATVAAATVSFVGALNVLAPHTQRITPSDVVSALGSPRSERTLADYTFPEWNWTDRVPKGSTIALLPREMPASLFYFLYGTDFRNHVVALTKADSSSPDALRRRLRAAGADYLFTLAERPGDRAARAGPACFAPTFHHDGHVVYRFTC
jgi:hypothetical protein